MVFFCKFRIERLSASIVVRVVRVVRVFRIFISIHGAASAKAQFVSRKLVHLF